jgi:hypothetical protein
MEPTVKALAGVALRCCFGSTNSDPTPPAPVPHYTVKKTVDDEGFSKDEDSVKLSIASLIKLSL